MPEFLPFLAFSHLFQSVDVTIDRIGPGSAALDYTISGTRDGARWPDVGGELSVSDKEGAELCAQDFADPVATPAKPERATAKRAAYLPLRSKGVGMGRRFVVILPSCHRCAAWRWHCRAVRVLPARPIERLPSLNQAAPMVSSGRTH